MADPTVPCVPSTDGARLATALRAASWSIDDAAHLLPAGRCTPERLRGLATVLRQLAAHLDAASGILPGEVVDGTEGGRAAVIVQPGLAVDAS